MLQALSQIPATVEIFGQHFQLHDAAIVALLVLLEGVLSIDNALVLGLLAKRLPKHQQGKALTYGLVGAFVFRFIAIGLATYLMHWWIVKLFGGAYLVYVSVKHFIFEGREGPPHDKIAVGQDGKPVLVSEPNGQPLPPEREAQEISARAAFPVGKLPKGEAEPEPATAPDPRPRKHPGFWPTVGVIELTDIAFAVDSILAAIALVGAPPIGHDQQLLHPKMWVVFTGGFLGVILMRFAAVIFIRLLDRFPRFETSAYLLVAVIGGKLLVDWWFNTPQVHRVEFNNPHDPAFWVFWSIMVICFMLGFLPQRQAAAAPPAG